MKHLLKKDRTVKLCKFDTKRALKKQIKRLKDDVEYRDKEIDDLKADYAIAMSIAGRYKRKYEHLKKNLGEDKYVLNENSVA